MSVHRPAPVSEEPEVTLIHWAVRRIITEGTDHIIGFRTDEPRGGGRVSSAIKSWDKERKIATTRSGRTYHLKGKPGTKMDAEYVWSTWLTHNKLTPDQTMDVTEGYAS